MQMNEERKQEILYIFKLLRGHLKYAKITADKLRDNNLYKTSDKIIESIIQARMIVSDAILELADDKNEGSTS
jgi:hypothetical protein